MASENQLTSTEGMTTEQIVKARDEGRLDDYLATKRGRGKTPDPTAAGSADQGARGPRSDSPTAGKGPEEIVGLLEQGALDSYLREPSRRRRSTSS